MKVHKTKSWTHRLGHSLRWRLLALFLLLALAMSAAFIGGTKKAFSTGWREAVKPLLTDYVDRLTFDIGAPPDAGKARALVDRLPISVRIEGPITQFDSHPGRQFDQFDQFDKRQRDGDGQGDASSEMNRSFLKRKTADGHTITFGLGNMEWRRGPGIFGWLTLGMLLGLTALAFAYVRRLFKPLDDIGAGVQRFGSGNFSQPIAVARADELGELAGQINTMGQEIAQMLDAKRALLLAISHELRSPLTRARLNTELLPETSETQEARQALLSDLTEMARLITDLLESERLSGNHAALNLEQTDLGELVQEVVANNRLSLLQPDEVLLSVRAEPVEASATLRQAQGERFKSDRVRSIKVNIEANLPPLQLDRTRIRLLLRNLLDNAQRHGQGPIDINLSRTAEGLELMVRDHGPGIAPDQLPQLAQAFFRADAARQRSTGGVGLGLYLCRLVAQAHGGELVLENAAPGLRACVRLPI